MAKFDIRNTPLTSADISRGKTRVRLSNAVGFAGVPVVMGGLIALGITQNPAFHFVAIAGMAMAAIGVITTTADYAELPEESCGEFLQMCEKTAEGTRYRKLVLEQGRRFVLGEFWMMREWMKGTTHRAECKKLYGIPESRENSAE